MPVSIQNLYTQSRSLQAYTKALQVTGQNIASSADPNYARQQVTMQSALPGSVAHLNASAVEAGIKDTRDELVEAQIWREQGDLGYQGEKVSYLEQLELALFSGSNAPVTVGLESDESLSDGLVPAMKAFFAAWKDLSGGIDDPSKKLLVFQSAESLVERFHLDAQSFEDMRTTLDNGIGGSVSTVNTLLNQVATLQEQIGRLPAETTSVKMDLLTARDLKLSELSQYMSFTWTGTNSAPLESTLNVRMADGSTVDLLSGSQVNDTLSWDGSGLSLTGNGGEPAADRGILGGQYGVLTEDLANLENHWNALANELVTQVNALYNPTGVEGDFFDASSGMAGSIKLDLGIPSEVRAGSGGVGNDISTTLETLGSTDLSGSSTLSGSFLDDILYQQNRLAHSISSGRDQLSAQEKVVSFLQQEKSNRSGVDLDAEVTNLLQFQRSFQATSRVLRALDESLQTFLSDIS